MKKSLFIAAAAAVPAIAMAQAGVDVAHLSELGMRGTARFMSMGGAFTALGGDLSTLGQNPAGIGIYRSSEVGITLDLNFQSFQASAPSMTDTHNQTRFNVNNFGYIGTMKLYSEATPTFSFGASYSRINSFDRVFKGNFNNLGGSSLSNYVAAFTNSLNPMGDGYSPYRDVDLIWGSNYNPYDNAPWMSVLAYNSLIINNGQENSNGQISFQGLMGDGTTGSANFDIREKGHVDEYNITFGGNIYNTLYWGLGFGITDVDYTQWSYYGERLSNAYLSVRTDEGPKDLYYKDVPGTASYGLTNYLHSSGSGFNVKFGLILKPINEFRIGIAVHTPTWYSMTDTYWGAIDYNMLPNNGLLAPNGEHYKNEADNVVANDSYDNFHDYHLRTPWRIMVGAAGVIGGKAIISADYEYRGTNMQLSDVNNNEYVDVSDEIKTYYKGVNIFRVGAEYRVTPQLSLRAGYSYESSPVKQWVANDGENIQFAGTIPSYSFNKATQYITAGLGYRVGSFAIDLAYVNKHRESTWHAYSPIVAEGTVVMDSPQATVKSNYNQLVLSLGYKF
ncbi:OmpP1/FadL family transporter [Muribaculum intestinale]|uniref:OmpP1/FadL family transporter n=1 Tax=Muribaculum intestinale TaxID=1796646 RepID=UPI00241E7A23|nr:MtrB/PioB family outer membrane beta-barrel protein [Muribaculum intestinale]